MKNSLGFGLSLLVSASAIAATGAQFRIDLRDGTHIFATDVPVQRGSVVTFHQASGRGLTGLPAEEIVRIQASGSDVTARPLAAKARVGGRMTAAQTLAQPLQPGDILVLGPTGSGSQVVGQNGYGSSGMANGANSGYGTNVANNGAYGATTAPGAVPPGTLPNGQPFVPAAGDLARAPSGTVPTLDPATGLPTNANPSTVNVGPNATPVVAGSSQTAPAPGATQPIGPNGTPVLAQPGTPGSTAPVIGPNGTPAIGQPGAAQPNTAPNGTPAGPAPAAPAPAPKGGGTKG
ncbi:MAG: hypothetical protein ABI968_13620 [Acidobacteriota bacterium]